MPSTNIEIDPLIIQQLRAELDRERASRRCLEADLAMSHETFKVLSLSETYFRHLTEFALDLITILDADGTIRFESRSVATELGYEPADYVGKNAFEFVHPDDAPRVIEAFLKALQTHGNTPILSFRFRHKNGTYRILEGCGNNLMDDPAVAGIVFNSRDVTEKRQLEEQFLQSQKVQAIGQLTGGVAHDFNNILTAIIGYSDLTLRQISPKEFPESAGNLAEISKAAHRAAALTRQLLMFSRKQSRKTCVINLTAVIEDMEKMLRRVLGERIDLVTLAHPALGNVQADSGEVEQVLMNLAVNARDAMPEGGRLTIEASNVTLDDGYAMSHPDVPAGEYIMLRITDSGCGIPPEVQARMFEPFFTTKAAGEGTGLGLATCQGIIKQSGGHIAVSSEIGKGTSFSIYLPRVQEEADAAGPRVEHETIPQKGGTILLVEDEAALRELGEIVLQDLGFSVVTAENGRYAVASVEANPKNHFDLVLTDVVMPEMGGKELVARLRDISPLTKVIFCSGYTEDAISKDSESGVCTYFLQKPYSMAGLAQKLAEVMDEPVGNHRCLLGPGLE